MRIASLSPLGGAQQTLALRTTKQSYVWEFSQKNKELAMIFISVYYITSVRHNTWN